MKSFATRLIEWQEHHGRHTLPWQKSRDPYRIWLSEIMLQQTQVATVIPYYSRFLARFPNLSALANASEDEVLSYWSGLGYYARARNLRRAAQRIVREFGGKFPTDVLTVESLPGIGRSTAAAIAVFAFGKKQAILDGNVKRVLCRYFGIAGFPGDKEVEEALWRKSESLLPPRDIAAYIQGLMDLGAMVCARRQPQCSSCPLNSDCVAFASGRIEELPARRSRSKLSGKQTQWLVLIARGQVLLEKRPPVGVWGSLWCFPELPLATDAETWCAERYGALAGDSMNPFQHGFTHFTLTITPLVFNVKSARTCAQEPGTVWLDIPDAIRAAIPAPVRRVLQMLLRRDSNLEEKDSGLSLSLIHI